MKQDYIVKGVKIILKKATVFSLPDYANSMLSVKTERKAICNV